MKLKHVVTALAVLVVLLIIGHFFHHRLIKKLVMQVDSVQSILDTQHQTDSIQHTEFLSACTLCPEPKIPGAKIPAGTPTDTLSLFLCADTYYTEFNNFFGSVGGILRTDKMLRDYESSSTHYYNRLSYSYSFAPNTFDIKHSTLSLDFRLDHFDGAKTIKGTKGSYCSEWLCPIDCPGMDAPITVRAPSIPAGEEGRLMVYTGSGATANYYSNFYGSEGGTLSEAILQAMHDNRNLNCLVYKFVFVPDATCQYSRLGLEVRLYHYDDLGGTFRISYVPDRAGASYTYTTDWLCPIDCPMD